MKLNDFKKSFQDEILELQKLGVIKISNDGTILKTSFGFEVHEYMEKTNA